MKIDLTKQLIIESLNILNKEDKKISELYQNYNIDLINYEFQSRDQLIKLIKWLLNDTKKYDMVGWWLYENVEKVLYDKDNNITDDLNNAEDFVKYMLKEKNDKEWKKYYMTKITILQTI